MAVAPEGAENRTSTDRDFLFLRPLPVAVNQSEGFRNCLPEKGHLRQYSLVCRVTRMTPEVTAIITVGVALGGLIIALGGLMVAMFQSTNKRIDIIEQRQIAFEERFSALEQRQARLEGLMEGIRDMLARVPLSQ